MARRPERTRAARAGLARGQDPRRLRRNANKQALSRLEIGEGLGLDERSRLAVVASGASSVTQAPGPSPLKDDTKAAPSDFRVSQITSTTEPTGTALADLQLLRSEVETALEEIRANFATLTKRLNELSGRM